jgi:hypothetical protein
MSSAFERLQKLANEKRLKEKHDKPQLEVVQSKAINQPSAVSAPSTLSAARLVSAPSAPKPQLPISPEKDFTKVANSIVRQIPSGAFIGKSKQMYDYLYSLTRGAIKPTRSIRISKSGLMRGSGIKSTHTFYNNVRHLEAIKLIVTTRIDGEKGGNSYEVFLPEEINADLEQLAHLAQAEHLTQPAQKLPVVVSAETNLTALGSNSTNARASETPKTSFKDIENNDDEPFGEMNAILAKVFEKVSGKRPQKSDKAKLNELAELLAMELEIAATRTKSISNVPAFLTEHLRRRLIGKSVAIEGKAKTSKPTKAGKQEETVEEYEAEPLTEQGREAVLKTIQEYIGKGQEDFVMSQQDTYTTDDWDWLMSEIKKETE